MKSLKSLSAFVAVALVALTAAPASAQVSIGIDIRVGGGGHRHRHPAPCPPPVIVVPAPRPCPPPPVIIVDPCPQPPVVVVPAPQPCPPRHPDISVTVFETERVWVEAQYGWVRDHCGRQVWKVVVPAHWDSRLVERTYRAWWDARLNSYVYRDLAGCVKTWTPPAPPCHDRPTAPPHRDGRWRR